MVFGKIYGYINDGKAQKSLLVAELSGIELETTPNFKFGITNKEASYLKKFPQGQTPAFEGSDGLLLTESAAIAFHIAQAKKDTTLLGKNSDELTKIWQLILFMESSIIYTPSELNKFNFSSEKSNQNQLENSQFNALLSYLDYLNNFISTDKYLVGDTLTLADINLICNLNLIYKNLLNASYRKKYLNLTNYYENILNLPEFKKIIGDIKYKN